jgi:hypothetical protein
VANTTLRTVVATAVSVLFNTGLTVSGWINPTVTVICWSLIVPVVLIAYYWTRIWHLIGQAKRVRLRWPVTLAPIAPTQTSGQQAHSMEAQQVRGAKVALATDERPLVRDDELWEKTYTHKSFWMAEFARKTAPSGETQAIIRDRRFYDCDIYGPAIFGPLAADEIDKVFVDCEWIEDEEARSWSPTEKRQEYVGVVRLEDCRFEGCRLSRIALLMHPL